MQKFQSKLLMPPWALISGALMAALIATGVHADDDTSFDQVLTAAMAKGSSSGATGGGEGRPAPENESGGGSGSGGLAGGGSGSGGSAQSGSNLILQEAKAFAAENGITPGEGGSGRTQNTSGNLLGENAPPTTVLSQIRSVLQAENGNGNGRSPVSP